MRDSVLAMMPKPKPPKGSKPARPTRARKGKTEAAPAAPQGPRLLPPAREQAPAAKPKRRRKRET
jgi:hypothetical protein